jgi:hypothetical protein
VVKGMTDVQEEACWKIVHDRMMNYDALAVLLFTATATNLLLPRCFAGYSGKRRGKYVLRNSS